MAGIWVYSEDAVLAKEMITLAKELKQASGLQICAVTLGEEPANALSSLGVEKIIVLKGSSNWPEAYEQAVSEVLREEGADVVLMGGSVRGKYTAAKAAARLEAGLSTDAVKVMLEDGKVVVERIVYGGLAVATEEIAFPAFVTIPPHSYDAAAELGGSAECVMKEVTAASQVTVDAVSTIQRQGVDITKADRVLGIGRGVGKQEDLAMLEELADRLGAEIGCTRPISEDAKWYPVERYIGISGKVVKGSLYVGIGTSGQIQHVAGVRDCKVIVAINNNEKEPIFAAADYGIVGSYTDVVPALLDVLKQKN